MAERQEPMQGGLADSIAMLEQILEVMPQDEEALKALYNAYYQGGYVDRAFEYLNRLIDVVVGGGSKEAQTFVQQELPHFEVKFPAEVAAKIARLRTLSEPVGSGGSFIPKGVPAKTIPGMIEPVRSEIDISEELALAWRLYEENQLSQEEYSSVLHDLTEISSKDLNVPVSVLHVLNDRGFTQMGRIMSYLSNRSNTPFLVLADYELNEKVAEILPVDIPTHEGALPFAFMGNDLLVAVLNPFDRVLVDKVEKVCGHRCHTYLVEPDDYDAALGKLRALALK